VQVVGHADGEGRHDEARAQRAARGAPARLWIVTVFPSAAPGLVTQSRAIARLAQALDLEPRF
jgi:hypothetical protein